MRDPGRELDVMYRLSGLLAGGTSCLSFLRAVLREAMALTHSRGGHELVLPLLAQGDVLGVLALQAMGPGGTIDVSIDAAEGTITTAIRDEGKGIPPEVRAHLFTPFFTTKPDGTGLGLSIAQRIMEGHCGCIRVLSQRGEGTTVCIELPVRGERPHANDSGHR